MCGNKQTKPDKKNAHCTALHMLNLKTAPVASEAQSASPAREEGSAATGAGMKGAWAWKHATPLWDGLPRATAAIPVLPACVTHVSETSLRRHLSPWQALLRMKTHQRGGDFGTKGLRWACERNSATQTLPENHAQLLETSTYKDKKRTGTREDRRHPQILQAGKEASAECPPCGPWGRRSQVYFPVSWGG